jgi:hypothetical protein
VVTPHNAAGPDGRFEQAVFHRKPHPAHLAYPAYLTS